MQHSVHTVFEGASRNAVFVFCVLVPKWGSHWGPLGELFIFLLVFLNTILGELLGRPQEGTGPVKSAGYAYSDWDLLTPC